MRQRAMRLVIVGILTAAGVALAEGCFETSTAPRAPAPASARALAPAVASVTVMPSRAGVAVGASVQFAAAVRDDHGRLVTGVAVAWTSSNRAVATVSAGGRVTGVGAGTATIRATAGGKSGTSTVTVTGTSARPSDAAVLVGAGDVAECATRHDEATAALLDDIPGTVFLAGDNAYESGTAAEYAKCFHPSWGRHKHRTRPAPGNHEYETPGASGYFGYFGSAAGEPGKGYYSYTLGAWHVVVLNSNISTLSSSAQVAWLKSDLAAHPAKCTLAYWHHPRFSSGYHGNYRPTQPLWQALYDAGAEVVLNGHDHDYERFAPQTPSGGADATRGLRQFVVGTGGTSLRRFGSTKANSVYRYNGRHGVLKLELSAASYRWSFITTDGTVRDSGSGSCH